MRNLFFSVVVISFIISCKTIYTPKSPTAVSNMDIILVDTQYNRIDSIIAPYKSALDLRMNQVIGYSPKAVEKKKPSSALGSFLSDAMYMMMKERYSQLDFVVLNYGGIRSSLDSGEVTVRDIYQIMPFENQFVIIELNQKEFFQLIDLIKSKKGEPFSNSLLSNVNKNKLSYFLGTSDYLANGGDGYDFLTHKKGIFRQDTEVKLRDILFDYFEIYKEINFDFEPREL